MKIEITGPSGETNRVFLEDSIPESGWATIGRSSSCLIPLRDYLAPEIAARVFRRGEAFWVRSESDPIRLGDLEGTEFAWPAGSELRIGESRLVLNDSIPEPHDPETPKNVKPWKTVSESGRKILWDARRAATTDLSVHVTGETGVGKEVLANLIHAWSGRSGGPFVPINCGALPVHLAESELFGHIKGSFTGAHRTRTGALLQAHGGTLFLDEVGDLPLEVQVKLLRFLENGEIRSVGSDSMSHAQVRLVSATHKPLEKLVAEGKFRQDLYYRIASVRLEIPSLRDRPQDIMMLSQEFTQAQGKSISPQAIQKLMLQNWRGNVRELRHAIERACGLAGEFRSMIGENDFDFLNDRGETLGEEVLNLGQSGMLKLEEMERFMVIRALKLSHGHRAEAARLLGIARSTLFEMIKRHRIQGPRTVDFH